MNIDFFESIPLPAIFASCSALMIAASELGFRIGRGACPAPDSEASTSVAPMVVGALGMLGFVLALSFSIAAAQHETRRQNVVSEANAIGTTYLRADLLAEPYRTEVKRLVRQYVEVRLAATRGQDVSTVMATSAELNNRVWREVSAAATAQATTNTALMIQTTNEMIDMHATRVTGSLYSRIPTSIWLALVAITLLANATLGIQLGLAGKRRLLAVVPMSFAFAVLVTLVADLNRPMNGLITVGQQAMEELKASIDANNP